MKHLLRIGLFYLTIVWLAASFAFVALRILPGDAIQAQLMGSGASPATINERRMDQGLDESLGMQYVRYMSKLLRGDLGYSMIDGQPVTEMIGRALPATATLAIGAIIFSTVLGLTLGITASKVGNIPKILAACARIAVNVSLSSPIYWTSTLAIYVFSASLGILPSTGAGRISQLVLPVGILGFHTSGAIARVAETSIRGVASSDFVRTARAKGLPEHLIVRRHILRIGLLPVITVIFLQVGFLFSGTVITEQIFLRPGIGRLLFDKTLQQDYPAVQGIVIMTAIIYTTLNTIGDALYFILDPRVANE